MKNIFKLGLLVFSALFISLVISGCGAAATAIEKRDLVVQTKMSDSIFLEPVSPQKQIVYVKVRNTTDKDIEIEEQIKEHLNQKDSKL